MTFGSYNEDAASGCATTVAERKAIQGVLNNLGYRDKAGKLLSVDGILGPASTFAMAAASLKLLAEGKIKSPKDLCAYLRLGTASLSPSVPNAKAAPGAPGAPGVPGPSAPIAAQTVIAADLSAPGKGMSRNTKLALAFGGLVLGGLLIGAVLRRKPS